MCNREGYFVVSGEQYATIIYKWHSLGDRLLGWHIWNFPGKGPKWFCWGCKKHSRGPLYSNQEASTDPTYGVTGYLPQRWEAFQFKWLCMDCIVRLGYLW